MFLLCCFFKLKKNIIGSLDDEQLIWAISVFWENMSWEAKDLWKSAANAQNIKENRTGRRKIRAFWAFKTWLISTIHTYEGFPNVLVAILWPWIDQIEKNVWFNMRFDACKDKAIQELLANMFPELETLLV